VQSACDEKGKNLPGSRTTANNHTLREPSKIAHVESTKNKILEDGINNDVTICQSIGIMLTPYYKLENKKKSSTDQSTLEKLFLN
jgi:hypothetical protein